MKIIPFNKPKKRDRITKYNQFKLGYNSSKEIIATAKWTIIVIILLFLFYFQAHAYPAACLF